MNTIYLKHPAALGERSITELTLQNPTVQHMIAGDKYPRGSHEYECAVMAAMTGVPEIVIREMDYEDFIHADAVMGQRFNTFYEVQRALTESDPPKAPQE